MHCGVLYTNLQALKLISVNLVNHFLISVHLQNKNTTFYGIGLLVVLFIIHVYSRKIKALDKTFFF